MKIYFAFCLLAIFAWSNCSEKIITRARIETCAGCKLYDLPELKSFIFDDFTQYKNTELKLVPGAIPELLFLDVSDNVIERIDLRKFGKKECNEILVTHGFLLKKEEL
ncbi:hypothetical protein FQA39_LY02601 [Lamprigera yunnana]|nr:hypothetical protein FQA39_LY02601 [Lamprigera yunnana]